MTDYKLASRRNFDRQAAQYDTASFGRHARALYPVLLAQLAQIPHRSVLDVGCGTGALLRQIKDRWPESQCAGVDLSPGMVESAAAIAPVSTPISRAAQAAAKSRSFFPGIRKRVAAAVPTAVPKKAVANMIPKCPVNEAN